MFSLQNSKKTLALVGAAAIASLTFAAAPALAQSAYDQDGYIYQTPSVTVYAPRHVDRDPATGADVDVVSASRVVDTHDLDLSSDWGMHALNVRVDHAAREACHEIDYHYSDTVDDDDGACVQRAVSRAMGDVQDAVSYGDDR